MTFKGGDLVRLKSGGPLMTATQDSYVQGPGSLTSCVWFSEQHEAKYAILATACLEQVDLCVN